jgi:hypothetical protein
VPYLDILYELEAQSLVSMKTYMMMMSITGKAKDVTKKPTWKPK